MLTKSEFESRGFTMLLLKPFLTSDYLTQSRRNMNQLHGSFENPWQIEMKE